MYGNTALIGARLDDDNGVGGYKSVYVFNSVDAPVSVCAGWCKASLFSPNGKYEARTQPDGNFVVSEGETKAVLWSSGSYLMGFGPYALRMQTDGNLVLCDTYETGTWSTGTQGLGSGPYALVMQADCNLVIYCNYDVLGAGAPIWSRICGTESSIRC